MGARGCSYQEIDLARSGRKEPDGSWCQGIAKPSTGTEKPEEGLEKPYQLQDMVITQVAPGDGGVKSKHTERPATTAGL